MVDANQTFTLAEAFNLPVCPHLLMALHASLACAIPNAPWLKYNPQLNGITKTGLRIESGRACPAESPGLGIVWDWDAIEAAQIDGLSADLHQAG